MKKRTIIGLIASLICCSLLVTGCSFSKESKNTDISQTEEKIDEIKQKASETAQKDGEASNGKEPETKTEAKSEAKTEVAETEKSSEEAKADDHTAEAGVSNNETAESEKAGETENQNAETASKDSQNSEEAAMNADEAADTVGSEKKIVIVLDPGHGGGYTGAAYSGFVEKDMTLKVANMVSEYLTENYSNVEVYLTREKDSALSGDIVKDLEMRAEFAKQANADALVSLHFNASTDHSATGASVYITNRKSLNPMAKSLADCILKKLNELGLRNRGAMTANSNDMFDEDGKPLDYYAINRHCANRGLVGIIVEHCFMDNESDRSFMDTDGKLLELAKADAEGIADYFVLVHK